MTGRSDGALIRAKIVSMRPIDEKNAKREDGTFTPAIATIQVEVTIKGDKDVAFLNGKDFDNEKDIASGFARVEPNKNDDKKFHLEFGGIRKWEPKPQA